MSTEIAVQQPGSLTENQKPESLLEVIARAVADPRMDVEKMSRLLDMHERIMADQRKTAFMAAMSRLQSKLPQIRKDGRIVVKGTERSRYARIEDIDVAIRPLLAEEGFAFSFDCKPTDDPKLFMFYGELSHREGYSVMKTFPLPMDKSDYRSDVQSMGSSESYAKRRLIKMHLNIVERGEDDGGQGGDKPITENQATDLKAMMTDATIKADTTLFLKFMGVEKVENILARDLQKAINMLEAKRRSNANK